MTADDLPDDGWALVGGLMVQLHAYRYGQAGVRATIDIDVLANSRQQPRSTHRDDLRSTP